MQREADDLGASAELAEEFPEHEPTFLAELSAFAFRLAAFLRLPSPPATHDASDAFVVVRARTAVGSPSWPQTLLGIYQHWAGRMGFGVEWTDGDPDGHGDHVDGVLRISGPFAYGLLRGEVGVHALGTEHLAAVDVLPDGALPPDEVVRQVFRVGMPSPFS